MVNIFWLKGFYFERRVFFYSSLNLVQLYFFKGISDRFFAEFFLRLPGFETLNSAMLRDEHRWRSFTNSALLTEAFERIDIRILLVKFLVVTFPIFLELYSQQRSNVWKYFLIKSRRGIFLKMSRPLGRRTRSRTFLKKNQTKSAISEKPSRTSRATSRWF
jgi:hypothetical protein